MHGYTYIYTWGKKIIYNIYKMLAIVVKGDQKAPFSLATTPRWREMF